MRLWLILLVACAARDEDGDGWDSHIDCDDKDGDTHPSAAELCNGRDDNCDGLVDIGAVDAMPWFADADGDGVGNPSQFVLACDAPAETAADALDCDDDDDSIHPDAVELCDGIDNDCDGQTDEDASGDVPRYPDIDGDGHGDPSAPDFSCIPPAGGVSLPDDCNDLDSNIYPGAAELCDGIDQDCDDVIDEEASDATLWYPDFDGDGFGWVAVEVLSCLAPSGYISDGTDCDDFDPQNHPGADERCDFVDNDCDSIVDGEQAIDPVTWYRDLDEDGFGSASIATACFAPEGYVSLSGDCNDASTDTSPLAPEVCDNGSDDDCNGLVDECGNGVPVSVFSVDDVSVANWTAATNNVLETVVSAGDLDGDGRVDLAFGAQGAGPPAAAGVVWLLYGADTISGDNQTSDLPSFAGATANDRLTQYSLLSSVGDLDGDGRDELMAGAVEGNGSGGSDVGMAALLYGDAVRESGAQSVSSFDAIFSGSIANDGIGHGIAGLGDIDGDGFDDASFSHTLNSSPTGTVYLLYGSDIRASGALSVAGLPKVVGEPSDALGIQRGVAGGDLDGDGLSDIVIGATFAINKHLHILYGDPIRPNTVDATDLPEVVESTEALGYDFARLVRVVGDLNGDGYPEMAVADPDYTSVGRVWLIGGSATRFTGTSELSEVAFTTIEGLSLYGKCGWEISGLGDVSGDGVDDLAVSAPAWAGDYTEAGGVGIFYGSLLGSVRFDDADRLIEGSSGGVYLGYTIAAGDVDGDGLVDLAMVASGVGVGAGRVYLVLGGTL